MVWRCAPVFKISDADVLPTGAGFSILPPQSMIHRRVPEHAGKDHASVKYPLKLSTDPSICILIFGVEISALALSAYSAVK